MKDLWKNYSLGIVLALLFLASWFLQAITGWQEFKAEAIEHGESASVWGGTGYVWPFLQATFENWQSEFLQLLTFVVLTTYVIYRHSHESKDSQEEMQRTIDRLELKLDRMSERIEDPIANGASHARQG